MALMNEEVRGTVQVQVPRSELGFSRPKLSPGLGIRVNSIRALHRLY